MSHINPKKEELVKLLTDADCIKFGQFTLKSGIVSPYYIDLRQSTMYHELFRKIVELIDDILTSEGLSYDESKPIAVVGVPYGVVPVAAAVAYHRRLPYYPVRKETKDYGHKPDSTINCNFQHILIEDVMSSGSSIIETIQKMEGKKITHVIVIVDRELGGEEKLKTEYPNIKLRSILKVSELNIPKD